MSKVMVTIQGPDTPPTVGELRDRYGLDEDEIDAAFGVVEIDPDDHLYTVLVDETAVDKIHRDEAWQTRGPFSNPRIEPFGPPEAAD